jgi:biopolymer transport protein TolR
MSRHKKHLDFELNLVPFIDLLSTCICFLLMTAVWTQVGSVDTKQAVGGQPAAETEKKPTIWVNLADKNALDLEVRDAHIARNLAKVKVDAAVDGKLNWDKLEDWLKQLRQQDPAITTALIHPQAGTVYEDIIDMMDRFKKVGVINLGVSPL